MLNENTPITMITAKIGSEMVEEVIIDEKIPIVPVVTPPITPNMIR